MFMPRLPTLYVKTITTIPSLEKCGYVSSNITLGRCCGRRSWIKQYSRHIFFEVVCNGRYLTIRAFCILQLSLSSKIFSRSLNRHDPKSKLFYACCYCFIYFRFIHSRGADFLDYGISFCIEELQFIYVKCVLLLIRVIPSNSR